MKILGIQLGHNSTVALLEEGKITCAVSEEKFDNIKNSSNFPSRSIRWILESRSLNPRDINYIAVSGILIYPRQLELVESRSETYSKGSSTRDYIKYILAKRFPDYWRLINYFKQLTGIGSVLNTSFNLHSYPLVATLGQAIFTFENSGLKYLALENFLISKE